MKITSQGSGVYRADGHTVDVRAWQWNGSCTCLTFTGCCLYLLTNQQKPRHQRCDHIEQVHKWIMNNEYPVLIEANEKIITLTSNELAVAMLPAGR